MCERSQLDLFTSDAEGCQASSSEALHVRTPAQQTPAEKALMESAQDFSLTQSGSSTSADLFGLALRTSLASELEARTGFALRWKRSATPSGRSWWVLGTPAHRTSETECGSSLQTPTKAGNQHQPSMRKHQWCWTEIPTPLAEQGRRSHRGTSRTEANGKRGADLASVVLATPTARDWRSGHASDTTHSRNSRPLSEQLQKDHSGTVGRAVLLAVCEWLMGYPAGWLSAALPLTEMRLFRRSQKRSGGR